MLCLDIFFCQAAIFVIDTKCCLLSIISVSNHFYLFHTAAAMVTAWMRDKRHRETLFLTLQDNEKNLLNLILLRVNLINFYFKWSEILLQPLEMFFFSNLGSWTCQKSSNTDVLWNVWKKNSITNLLLQE